MLLPGDGLWWRASLHCAFWAISALTGDWRSARCGSPGQWHLPWTLLSDQGPPTCPTNCHCEFPRGVFHWWWRCYCVAESESFVNVSRLTLLCLPPGSLRGVVLMGSRAPVSTSWWLLLMLLSSWSGPPTQTTWLRAGMMRFLWQYTYYYTIYLNIWQIGITYTQFICNYLNMISSSSSMAIFLFHMYILCSSCVKQYLRHQDGRCCSSLHW